MACFVRVLQGWSEKFCPFYFGKKTNPNTTKKHAFCFVSSNFVPKSLNMTWNISSCAGSWALHWTLLIFITSNRFSEYRGTTASWNQCACVRQCLFSVCDCVCVSACARRQWMVYPRGCMWRPHQRPLPPREEAQWPLHWWHRRCVNLHQRNLH